MTAPSAGKRSLNKGSAHQNQAQEGSCPCVFQIKELQVVPRLGKEGNPPKQSRLSTESRELTCCLRWVSCCFISSHILCDSTASFSSWERAKHYLGMLSAHPCTAEARGAQQGSSLAPENAQGAAKIWDNAQGCAVRGKKQKVQPPEKCSKTYKVLLPLVPLLRLLQHLLGLLQFGIHQLLLQLLVLEHLVNVLPGGTPRVREDPESSSSPLEAGTASLGGPCPDPPPPAARTAR